MIIITMVCLKLGNYGKDGKYLQPCGHHGLKFRGVADRI